MQKQDDMTHVISEEYFNGDILITDPCYIIPDDRREDWVKSNYGEFMCLFDFSSYLCELTPDGDWSCEVFKGSAGRIWDAVSPEEKVGEFTADACRVGVFYLQEILDYNPAFDLHIKMPICACRIHDFQGTVQIVRKRDPEGEESMHVIGIGNQPFFSRETYWSKVFPYKKSNG